ncbi:hypothetical protein GYMLUDRAFT_68009 [Collybiopsis luxurians FD-317 M1]|nr:hypothetical protein GYMLUDRAFT_68009 [Collybiopsis luxurians FD-317 M1]
MNPGSYFPPNHDEGHSLDLHSWNQAKGELTTKQNLASVVFVPSPPADMYHCPSTSQPLWHVQYYSETLEPSSSVSLFAQTTKEEDDIFYATFPEARSRSWTPHAISHSEYFGDTAFSLSPRELQHPVYDTPPLPGTFKSTQHDRLSAPPPAQIHSSSELMAAINLCGGESAAQIDSNPLQPTSTSSVCSDRTDRVLCLKIESVDCPPSQTENSLLPEVKSANQVKGHNNNDEPLMDFLAPPSVKEEGTSFQDQQLLSGLANIESSSKIASVSSPSGVGSQPTARRSFSSDSRVVKHEPSPNLEGAPASAMPTIAIPSPRAAESPSPRSDISSELSGFMRLSPLPMNRRPAEKKKAQTLACNFCRVRKIACGPPLAGTVEKTCNQCQRRSRECVFPTESRRGMRKKKNLPAP